MCQRLIVARAFLFSAGLAEARHAVLFDRPDEALAVLRAWLGRQDQRPY